MTKRLSSTEINALSDFACFLRKIGNPKADILISQVCAEELRRSMTKRMAEKIERTMFSGSFSNNSDMKGIDGVLKTLSYSSKKDCK